MLRDILQCRMQPNKVVASFPSQKLQIRAGDVALLLDRQSEINDIVVDFYMEMLVRDGRRNARIGDIFCFTCFFATALSKRGPQPLRRWATGLDLATISLVMVPLNHQGEHWSLLTVDYDRRVVEVFDSCLRSTSGQGYYSDIFVNIVKFLDMGAECQGAARKAEYFDRRIVVKGVPQQEDGASCGIFMLMFASCIAKGLSPPFRFNQGDINSIRCRLSLAICSAGTSPDVSSP